MKKIIIPIILMLSGYLAVSQDERPNILLILSDQHAGRVMTQRGYPHINTPAFDQLAEDGVTFTRAYVSYPVCIPSRAAMITGKMPSKSSNQTVNHKSIGKVMKENGYETAYYGKWHVGDTKMKKTEDWHGFDDYADLRGDTEIRKLSNEFLSKEHEKPFFLVTSFVNPHDCCQLARNMSGFNDEYHDGPVEENAELSKTPPLPDNFEIPANEAEGFYVRRAPDSTNRVMFRKHPVKYWGRTKWRQYMYGYNRLVEKVDRHIALMLEKLEEQGQLENTVIIYTSDHGDGHASHQWNQKMTFYEEAINVPFIISWKGQLSSSSVIDTETLVNTGLDLFPTISSFAGIPSQEGLLGIDLAPSAFKSVTKDPKKGPVRRNYTVSEIRQLDPSDSRRLVGRMVVTCRYKYFLFNRGENREQLFDLQEDPGELNPVTDNPDYVHQLVAHREMLKDWIKRSNDPFDLAFIP